MAASIIIGAVGLGLAAYGAIKKGQAEKKAKQNLANRPKYSALPEDQSELRLAEQQANVGMGGAAKQQLQNNTDRQLAANANAIMMGGGNANAIAGLADRTQNAYNNNAIYDDQTRQAHISQLLGTYNQYNAMRQGNADKSFQYNEDAPWKDRQQLYSSQMAGGQQTMNSGINIATQSIGGMNFGGNKGGVQSQPYGNTPNYGQVPYQSAQNQGGGQGMQGNYSPNYMGDSTLRGGGYGGYEWNGITPFYNSGG